MVRPVRALSLISMTSRVSMVMACLAIGIAVSEAQSPSPSRPARDTPGQSTAERSEPVPTGLISGRILAADTGRPVKRARVLLNAAELPGGRGALTDDDGLFEFAELPKGRYTLGVSKSGFVALTYGQRRPLQAGTPLQLNDGQQLKAIDFRLPRGSVIAGQVVDESGDAMPGTTVRAMMYQYAQGARQLMPAGSAVSDDRGQFRIWGLNPGEYYLSAVARNFTAPGGGPFGRGGRGATPGNTPAVGFTRPGVAGAPNVGGVGAPPDQRGAPEESAYAPTYYPGVESLTDARPVRVALGAEVLDIDFGLLLVRTARISGRVTSNEGADVSTGNVTLTPEGQNGRRPAGSTVFGARIQWNGVFELANVPPGRYILSARGDDWAVPQFATQPLTVASGDLTGVNVMLLPGAAITGTVSLERSKSIAVDPTQFRVSAPMPDLGAAFGPNPQARVDKEGRFTLEGVAVGPHTIRAQMPRGWVLKAVTVDGRDVTDTPIDLRSGQRVSNVTVVFTDKLSEINGLLTDDRGTPITDYTMLAFPADPALWRPQARHILTARPDQTGKFQIRGLPPGEYLLAAVDPAEQGEWFEPSFLDEHRGGATRVTLGDGDVKTQNLRIATR
jgi:hypothetical protein